ncbi:hypothetical protein BDV97DRAFT_366793 [Delphinella strobiligena]|nr:hypothetical protein BDV97DRAFT_366793 [Delphinella strobiligena]
MEAWKGSLILSDGHSISDIHIGAASAKTCTAILTSTARLRFLAFVDTSRIPIHLIHGPRLDVWTDTEETESWFSKTLLNIDSDEDEAEWWHTARPESPLGVLAAVDTFGVQEASRGGPRITEVLFLASRSSNNPPCPPTPPHSSQGTIYLAAAAASEPLLNLHAFTLSSDLIQNGLDDISPPASPTTTETDTISATLLPDPFATQQLNPAPPKPITTTLKRKNVHDTFTEAESLRKRVRQRPGESVQAASAHPPSMPSLKQMTSNSFHSQNPSSTRPASASGNVPIQTRPLSRSPSITSAKAASTKATTAAPKRSNLARVQSALTTPTTDFPKDAELEAKNKDLLSRLVMAGMRLHGLSQSKSKTIKPQPLQHPQIQPRRSSPAHSILAKQEPDPTVGITDAYKNEEFRLIYHQTFRGATFAFRDHISSASLHPHTEILREVVDKLLVLFCGDPLARGLADGAIPGSERITPGGRKVFETPGEVEGSPFGLAGGGGGGGEGDGEQAITPSFRKRGKAREVA